MYEIIVVPLDGSRLAEVALPYAEELAVRMGSEIILLSVLEAGEAYESRKHQAYIGKITEDTKRHVKKHLEQSGGRAVKVGIATRTGYPAEEIVNYVNKGGYKLIVMATHGRSGIKRWALGSVADMVIRSTTRQPIMLIRGRGARSDVREKGIMQQALVPLDGSIKSEAVVPYIEELAATVEAELTLLQVVPRADHARADAEGYLQGMCNRLEDKGITARYQVETGSAADEIIALADKLNVGMVAMSTHGRTGVSLWALGSVAQKVLLGGNIPLLLVKD